MKEEILQEIKDLIVEAVEQHGKEGAITYVIGYLDAAINSKKK